MYLCQKCGRMVKATEAKHDSKIKATYGPNRSGPLLYQSITSEARKRIGKDKKVIQPDDLGHDPSITWISDEDVSGYGS